MVVPLLLESLAKNWRTQVCKYIFYIELAWCAPLVVMFTDVGFKFSHISRLRSFHHHLGALNLIWIMTRTLWPSAFRVARRVPLESLKHLVDRHNREGCLSSPPSASHHTNIRGILFLPLPLARLTLSSDFRVPEILHPGSRSLDSQEGGVLVAGLTRP